VSDRVYRDAWASERALALLREESTTKFDGACVGALARVLARCEAAEAQETYPPQRAAAADARGRVGGVGPGLA
jgi:HD-GYP domain-containing protein (c-di-GMP phosphodiesterase class II)